MRKRKKKVAIFDIDGTIFRSSLLIEVMDALIQAGYLKPEVSRGYEQSYQAWLDRKGSYDRYILDVVTVFHAHIVLLRHRDFLRVAEQVARFHRSRVYRYTRDLVRDLKRKGYYLLVVSHSPKIVLDFFCAKLGFDKVYGTVYEVGPNGWYTGEIIYDGIIADKAKIVRRAIEKGGLTLRGSIGVGDTESDISFLKLVDRPICFNPNQKLYRYAKKAGWEIVVERKDVLYRM